jgi:hypothetical protein
MKGETVCTKLEKSQEWENTVALIAHGVCDLIILLTVFPHVENAGKDTIQRTESVDVEL